MHNVYTTHAQRESLWEKVKISDCYGNPSDKFAPHALKRVRFIAQAIEIWNFEKVSI